MDRETVLKHSKSIRINHQILPDFVEVISDFCERKQHPEYLQQVVKIIQIPMIGQQALDLILKEYEREYHIITLVKLNDNKIIDIW